MFGAHHIKYKWCSLVIFLTKNFPSDMGKNSDGKSDSSKKATKWFFTSGTVWLWFRVQVSWGRGSNYNYFPLKNVSCTCMPHLVVYSCRQQHPRNTRGYIKEKPRSSFFKDQSILYTNYMEYGPHYFIWKAWKLRLI